MIDTELFTGKEVFQTEKDLVVGNPLLLITDGFLTIKTKSGELLKLTLNSVQRKFLAKIIELLKKNKPIRLWVLKARQAGMSTLIEAILYAFTSQSKATNTLVISYDVDGSNYIFEMQKLFHELLDNHLRPEIKHSNEKKLEFDKIHSQILVDTSDNLQAGRSYTFRFVHLSEVAFYRDLETLMLGLSQSVPNLPGTIIIGETTANGIGNRFYDEWIACSNGTSSWETFFIGWHEIEEYTLPLESGQLYPIEGIDFATASDKQKFLIEEENLRLKYNLTKEQINWRRWCMVNNCGRSVLKFNQEYPDCPETAFIATGDLFFDKEGLKKQVIQKPIAIGNIVREDGQYRFREDNTGLFKFYKFPKRDEQFVIGADPAEGLEHGDKSSAVVLNKRTNEVVCAYNHNIPPDRFAEDLIKVGNYFNECIIACENKGYGYAVNQDLYKKYGKVYRKVQTKTGVKEQTLDLGFNTNSTTRPQILAQLAEEIFDGSTKLNDRDLVQQCWTFINNAKRGQPEAEKGKSDDMVMARAIAGQVRQQNPFKEKFYRLPTRKRFKGLSGY